MDIVGCVLIVSLLVFLMLDLAPGDGAANIAGAEASEARIEQVRTQLRLDEPVLARYVDWLTDAVQGDFGQSLVTGEQVATVVGRALAPTAGLTLVAIVFMAVGGIVLGCIPSLWPHRIAERICTAIAIALLAMAPFWLAILLVRGFAVDRQWLPALGYTPISSDPLQWFRHMVLPAAVLAAQPAGELARQLRASLADAQHKDFHLAVLARGFSRRRVVLKHTLKNAIIPVITVTGIRVAQLLGGTAIVEIMFSINGLGRLAVDSVLRRDVPIVIALVVVTTLVVVIINQLVEATYGIFNPQLRRAPT